MKRSRAATASLFLIGLGSLALPAQAKTVAVDYQATAAGTPITIGASATPQYSYYFGQFFSFVFPDSYAIAGNNGATVAFPDNGVAQMQLPEVATSLNASIYTDGNYQLMFNIGSVAYTGLAAVTDNGTLIDSITYNPVSGSASAAPEPSTWLLMIVGIGGIGFMLRQAKRKMGFRFKDALVA